MCSIAGSHGMSSSNAESTPQDTADFVKKTVTCRGTKVPRVSLYRVVKTNNWWPSQAVKIFILSDVVASLGHIKSSWGTNFYQAWVVLLVEFTQLLINLCRNRTAAFLSSFGLMVNKIDRPNTTPTVCGISTFAVYFSVFLSAFLLLHFCLWRAFRIVS